VLQDDAEAMMWFRKAADQGHEASIRYLANGPAQRSWGQKFISITAHFFLLLWQWVYG
jgi:TPR repeat protein